MPDADQDELLRRQVAEVEWYHSIDLGRGIVTRGVADTRRAIELEHMPGTFSGKSVLDIGAWDGFYSFEAERRAARRVLAVDSFAWRGLAGGRRSKAGFELARRALGSRVEDTTIDVLDLSPRTVGVFDVVFFFGVLYHMRHPLLALERVASVTGETLLLSTQVDLTGLRGPAMRFYPDRELNGDSTNWWGPNHAAVEGMLRDVGFRRVELVSKRPRTYRLARALYHRWKFGTPILQALDQDFAVYHAWR